MEKELLYTAISNLIKLWKCQELNYLLASKQITEDEYYKELYKYTIESPTKYDKSYEAWEKNNHIFSIIKNNVDLQTLFQDELELIFSSELKVNTKEQKKLLK